MPEEILDLIVVGGGAAGLAAATVALGRGKTVRVLEAGARVGRKILAAGGGKCNLSNVGIDAKRYNTDRAKDIIAVDVRGFFESLGVKTKTVEDRVYPYSESGLTVLDALRGRCKAAIRLNSRVNSVEKTADGLYLCNGLRAKNILVCTGSPATFGLDSTSLVRPFSHFARPFVPSLVPLRTDPKYARNIANLRAKCRAALISGGRPVCVRQGEILFRRDGASGIASMELSAHIARHPGNYALSIDFAPDLAPEEVRAVCALNGPAGLTHRAIAEAISSQARDRGLEDWAALKDFRLTNARLGPMSNATVCAGGISLEGFDSSLRSLRSPGLHCAGEALDVDGDTGGFNLHFAFASGIAVGRAV